MSKTYILAMPQNTHKPAAENGIFANEDVSLIREKQVVVE